ncbi:MAG TPA: pyridoxamine 5'-phosphate oxidase family protein [Candidatus Udaeobacter sp.]|nr:pyridoxamine 5'-phosphate oxidase family protein [Candidatus Udaeobacter sp.]
MSYSALQRMGLRMLQVATSFRTEMSDPDSGRLWSLMESIRFCMLSNWNGPDVRSRPMAAVVRREEGAIYFLMDARRRKIEDIRKKPRVHLAFSHPGRQKYVSLQGSAEVSSDRVKINELWSIGAKVWWRTSDNPNICIVKVTPIEGEYWDSPHTWISNLNVAFGLLVGRHPYTGEHRRVTF